MDQLEQSSQQMPISVESEAYQDGEFEKSKVGLIPLPFLFCGFIHCAINILGESVPDRRVSPEKLYRAALLKNRFADTILKAREKTLVEVSISACYRTCYCFSLNILTSLSFHPVICYKGREGRSRETSS